MSDTDELLAELEREEDTSTSGSGDRSTGATGSTGSVSRTERLAARAGRVFSPRKFVLVGILVLAGLFLGGFIPLGPIGGFIGVFLGTFAFGLLSGESRYAESAVAGGLATGLSTFFDYLVLTFVGVGLPVVLVGAGLGAALGLVGHYFGRDLRAGLTADIDVSR